MTSTVRFSSSYFFFSKWGHWFMCNVAILCRTLLPKNILIIWKYFICIFFISIPFFASSTFLTTHFDYKWFVFAQHDHFCALCDVCAFAWWRPGNVCLGPRFKVESVNKLSLSVKQRRKLTLILNPSNTNWIFSMISVCESLSLHFYSKYGISKHEGLNLFRLICCYLYHWDGN